MGQTIPETGGTQNMSETITPNIMPGATTDAPKEPGKPEPKAPEAKTTKVETPPEEGLSADERAELERLRAVHRDERKQEKRAKDNFDDAERWRKMLQALGGETPADQFDPQAEFQRLREEVTNERTERIRAEVARTENVPPKYVRGTTEDEMRAAAAEYKADIESAIDAAVKGRAPAAVPASEVTSNGKVAGPNQITSRDQLKNMTTQEITAAQKEGRLDYLMGKTP
jgi:hypothetical protein